MKFIFFLLTLFTTLYSPLLAKVRIFTFHYNKPDFIEFQHRTLEKFLQDNYELIVFNDAREEEYNVAIRNTCERLGIKCIRYEPEWHFIEPLNDLIYSYVINPNVQLHVGFSPDLFGIANQPSVRHCHVIQYALNQHGYSHDDIVVILDGDCFPIRPVSIRALIAGKGMIGAYRYVREEGIGYMWVPFVRIDTPHLHDHADLMFHLDVINNKLHDSGAHSYHYMVNHPQVVVGMYAWHASSTFHDKSDGCMYQHGFNAAEIELTKALPWPSCVEFHVDHHFLHFGASSFYLEGHDDKVRCIKDFLNKILL